MMDYNFIYQGMMNGNSGLATPFIWVTYLLCIVVLILVIIALLKYINKK